MIRAMLLVKDNASYSFCRFGASFTDVYLIVIQGKGQCYAITHSAGGEGSKILLLVFIVTLSHHNNAQKIILGTD